MMTLGGHEVDIGGMGPTETMYWLICLSALPQFWTPDLNVIETTHHETHFQV